MSQNGLLLDWITLRIPVRQLPPILQERLYENMDTVACMSCDINGMPTEIKWESKRLNFDALRSDADGLYFTSCYVGTVAYFYIGASPASLQHENNVFGSMDILSGADALIARAQRAFSCFLARAEEWELCRLDVTGNYAFPDFSMVKTCLRTLLQTDSARRKATSAKNGGDTVLWSPSSDLIAGKAYHKGPHLRYLREKKQIEIDDEHLSLADRLVRLEMRIGSRFWRLMRTRSKHQFYGRKWWALTAEELAQLHKDFFGPIVEGVEVRDMGRADMIELIAAANDISHGRAKAAYGTYRAIKDAGLDEVRAGMAERTFFLHKKYLKSAGITDGDLMMGNVIQFRPVRILLAHPVASWDDIRKAA